MLRCVNKGFRHRRQLPEGIPSRREPARTRDIAIQNQSRTVRMENKYQRTTSRSNVQRLQSRPNAHFCGASAPPPFLARRIYTHMRRSLCGTLHRIFNCLSQACIFVSIHLIIRPPSHGYMYLVCCVPRCCPL
jgi:hypothetical protein